MSATPTFEELKDRFLIDDAYALSGLEHEHRKLRRCPLHHDRNPSCSVFDHGRRFHCFGCGAKGDGVDLLAALKNITLAEARQMALKHLGAYREPIRQERTKQEQRPLGVELPPAQPWDREIAQRVADSRELRITSVEFAAIWLKTVSFARVCGFDCWILYDRTRRCVEARRIDRELFPEDGDNGERKVHTLRGSNKSCPVGLFPPAFEPPWLKQHVHKLLLVEGSGDYLAACQIIAAQDTNILPVAMLGASQSITAGALPYFVGRETAIVAHPGKAGRAAGERWREQITGAGGSVRLFNLRGGDLNEIVTQGATLDDLQLF